MWCRIVSPLLVVLAVASCSSGPSNRAGSGTAGSASASSGAETLLRAYDIAPDGIGELGIALHPVPADQGLLVGPNYTFHVTQVGTATELSPAQRQTLVPWRPSPSALPALPGHEYLVVVAERFGTVKEHGVEALFHVGNRDVREVGGRHDPDHRDADRRTRQRRDHLGRPNAEDGPAYRTHLDMGVDASCCRT
jgi:hypothetical protein